MHIKKKSKKLNVVRIKQKKIIYIQTTQIQQIMEIAWSLGGGGGWCDVWEHF